MKGTITLYPKDTQRGNPNDGTIGYDFPEGMKSLLLKNGWLEAPAPTAQNMDKIFEGAQKEIIEKNNALEERMKNIDAEVEAKVKAALAAQKKATTKKTVKKG